MNHISQEAVNATRHEYKSTAKISFIDTIISLLSPYIIGRYNSSNRRDNLVQHEQDKYRKRRGAGKLNADYLRLT